MAAFSNWDTLGHVARSDFTPISRPYPRMARVLELMAALTLAGISCMYTFAVVLMLACRKAAWASFMVPCRCRSVPSVRRITWKVTSFLGIFSLSVIG
jgi:hypothetical protein